MTHEEILKKAIVKALNNGLSPEFMSQYEVDLLIYQHEFAKSFWGTEMKKPFMKIDFGKPYKLPLPKLIIKFRKKTWIPSTDWQYHLQQMVLEKDPIKYLEKFI